METFIYCGKTWEGTKEDALQAYYASGTALAIYEWLCANWKDLTDFSIDEDD